MRSPGCVSGASGKLRVRSWTSSFFLGAGFRPRPVAKQSTLPGARETISQRKRQTGMSASQCVGQTFLSSLPDSSPFSGVFRLAGAFFWKQIAAEESPTVQADGFFRLLVPFFGFGNVFRAERIDVLSESAPGGRPRYRPVFGARGDCFCLYSHFVYFRRNLLTLKGLSCTLCPDAASFVKLRSAGSVTPVPREPFFRRGDVR